MPEKIEVENIGQGGEVKKEARRFDSRDWGLVAENVIDEFERRKGARKHLEKHWTEIDRQVAMDPNVKTKAKAWMAEMELPLQAQALEVLVADARRMQFPDNGPWFRAHAETTDEYLRKADFQSLILGDESEVPSQINQDNADKLVEGFLLNIFRQYDMIGRFDRINAEAFKYGMGVGRGRMETKSVYIHEARGVFKENKKIPVIVPASVKNLYLDDPLPSMHSAQVLSPAHIAHDYIKYENLAIAASKGSKDPDDEDGGWMPKALNKIEPDKNGYVQVLEMEGDIIIPRKSTKSFVIPNAIVTVVKGEESGGTLTKGVIRLRFRKDQFSSWLLFPYHFEGADDHYPTSPLMKGRPIQIMAVDALNRLMDAAALQNGPPVSYDKNDVNFSAQGGPEIFPYAQWPSNDPNGIKAHVDIGGDPSTMLNVFQQAVNLYAELTGVLPARLGAQTVSHTTAFAKDAELQRGAVRTVDYVRASGAGPITRWLDMAYQMGRNSLGSNETIKFFIDAYGGFVEIGKDALPENASFEWFGSGGPAEEQQKQQGRLNSLKLALEIDQLAQARGEPPTIVLSDASRQVLREGGWTDIDSIAPHKSATAGIPQAPNPGLATVALQGIQ